MIAGLSCQTATGSCDGGVGKRTVMIGSCLLALKGKVGLELTWNASSAYAYTLLKGKNEDAVFQCK